MLWERAWRDQDMNLGKVTPTCKKFHSETQGIVIFWKWGFKPCCWSGCRRGTWGRHGGGTLTSVCRTDRQGSRPITTQAVSRGATEKLGGGQSQTPVQVRRAGELGWGGRLICCRGHTHHHSLLKTFPLLPAEPRSWSHTTVSDLINPYCSWSVCQAVVRRMCVFLTSWAYRRNRHRSHYHGPSCIDS